MAGFASQGRAVGAALRHAAIEFAMMDIRMAPGTGHVFELKRQDLIGPAGATHFVAIGTRDGGVRASQDETSLAMFGDCECGAVKV